MWPFAHRDRPLQLRVFGSFSPLSPPAIIHSDLRKKKEGDKKKKKSRTSCAPFAPGTHPCKADRCLFQPIIPPSAVRRPRFLCSYEIFTCSELVNSSLRLSSHQPLQRNSLHEEGGTQDLFQGSWRQFSCLPRLLGFREGSGLPNARN